MKVKKTIKAKILELRKGKEELLKQEYGNFQRYLHGDRTALLYSATQQQAERLLKRIGKPKGGKEYPMVLRRDVYRVYRVYRADTKLTPYWFKIPIYGVNGGINLPIKTHEPITEDMTYREAKIIKRKGEWFAYITVEKEVEERDPKSKSVLAVDLGIRWTATTVNSNDLNPKFYGKELRRVKGHYFHLRRSLALKEAYKTIKRIGDKEKCIVNDILHKISRTIVNEALKSDAMIVLGKLKGIRENGEGIERGRRFNRKLNNGFPYYKLSRFIEYKARWLGIRVIRISERNTSKTCHRCNNKGLRVGSLFKCLNCNYSCNADYNGARNIRKRGLAYMASLGASLTMPELGRMKP